MASTGDLMSDESDVSIEDVAREVAALRREPLSPGPPRVAIVDDGSEGNALFIEGLEKRLAAEGWSFTIARAQP